MRDDDLKNFFDDELKQTEEQNKQNEEKRQRELQQLHAQRMAMYGNAPNYQSYQPNLNTPKTSKVVLVVLMVVTIIGSFFLGMFANNLLNPDLKMISDVLNLIDESALYTDEDGDGKYDNDLAYIAAKAMLESIDQYSTLLTPEEYYDLLLAEATQEDNNGMAYMLDDEGNYVIAEVAINSPAYIAGVFAGDKVVQMTVVANDEVGLEAGTYTINAGTDIDLFLKLIRSHTIQMKVEREISTTLTQQKNFTVTVAPYNGATIEYMLGDQTNMSTAYKAKMPTLPSNVGYIRLTTFMEGYTVGLDRFDESLNEMQDVMNKFEAEGCTKLIFDLTNNGGGRTDVATEIASYLTYDKNNPDVSKTLVSTNKDKNGNIVLKDYTNSVYDDYFDTSSTTPNIVLLTNDGSASASEMIAGAVLDYGTAVQVGTTTYGKGIGQSVMPLKMVSIQVDGKSVTSAWAAYFTSLTFHSPVTDTCPHDVGFTPLPENTRDSFSGMMARAIEILQA